MRYRFVAAERATFPVRTLCRLVGATASGFYAWLRREPDRRGGEDAGLARRIGAIFEASRRTYGSPRVHAELREDGVRIGRGRVARLMREAGLVVVRRRRVPRTTDSRHDHPVAPNLLGRNFAADRPDTVWLADISYIPTGEGWMYLAAIEDMATREIPPVPLRGPEGRLWLEHGRPPPRRARPRRPRDGDPAPAAAPRAGPTLRSRGAVREQALPGGPGPARDHAVHEPQG